jgi:hypothetical protein
VPAKCDVPTGCPAGSQVGANGKRNKVVNMSDVLAVLFYAFASPAGGCGDNRNANAVDYDCDKGADTNGDTAADIPPDGVADGLDYDRSAGDPPTPQGFDPAGPPNDIVNMVDVLAALTQAFKVDCSGGALSGGGGSTQTLTVAPNAMAVDAIPGGGIDSYRLVTTRQPFDVDLVVSAAGEPYAGYQASLSYDDQVLQFVPTEDLDSDTVAESWTYTALGGMNINAVVAQSDLDGDTVVDRAQGGSARSSGTTSQTGAVITARFRCLRSGYLYLHLATAAESTSPSTTLGSGGGTVAMDLADAWITCWVN